MHSTESTTHPASHASGVSIVIEPIVTTTGRPLSRRAPASLCTQMATARITSRTLTGASTAADTRRTVALRPERLLLVAQSDSGRVAITPRHPHRLRSGCVV